MIKKKSEPACDAECQKTCDKEADTMIRELKNPLNNITWNCKNNYDVYTTDYDPDHEHVDRMTMDVMDTNKAMNKIKELESKLKKSNVQSIEQDELDRATLNSLKKEMGIKDADLEWSKQTHDLKKDDHLDVKQAVHDAAAESAKTNGVWRK